MLTFQFFFLKKKRSVARGPMVVATPAMNSNCRCERSDKKLKWGSNRTLHSQLVRDPYVSHCKQAPIEKEEDSEKSEKQTKSGEAHPDFCSPGCVSIQVQLEQCLTANAYFVGRQTCCFCTACMSASLLHQQQLSDPRSTVEALAITHRLQTV